MKKITFPKAELCHDTPIEWWYFNGHLNKRYAFMHCLFRANLKEVKLPIFSNIPLKTLYFTHSLLSDLKEKKFYPSIKYIVIPSKDSFSKEKLFINYTDPVTVGGYINSEIEETEKFNYRLKTETLNLSLKSVKKPLLQGGKGYFELDKVKTYYYSLTNLETEGEIKIEDKKIKVRGKSWMDHQWAETKAFQDSWVWFSFQFKNNTELVCFKYGDGEKTYASASISYPDGKEKHTKKVEITPLGKTWKSPKTESEYELEWRVEIPSFGISLKTKPLILNQEIVFGRINYWEGPVKAGGGIGFMELVGRPSQYSNLDFLKDLALDTVKRAKAEFFD